MTALLWSLSIWSLVAVAWALIWGSIGWTRANEPDWIRPRRLRCAG